MNVERKAIAAAVRTADGVIHFLPAPNRHHHTVHALHRMTVRDELSPAAVVVAKGEQGFLMSDGTFANRIDAGKCAVSSGQIKKLTHPPELYSEDLW